MKKIICLILAAILSLTLLAGCKKEEETVVESSEPVVVVESSEPEPDPICNPLTGEEGYDEAKLNRRPVAVMINNIFAALPQYGIGCADIIYEIPVEGSITRMMAIYSDYESIPNVCSVRSCRYYYPIFALSYDAIYAHWGIDEVYALPVVNSLGVDRLDATALEGYLYFRDEDRANAGYAYEHTGYLQGDLVPQFIADKEFRTEKNEGYETAFNFVAFDETLSLTDACTEAVLYFSDDYYSTFTYDSANKVYLKQHSGSPQIDQSTGEQLSFTNVFALQTDVGYMDDGYHRSVGTSGGTGFYFTEGKYEAVNWSKASESAPIVITDASGNEISVNRGKSFIGIIDYSSDITADGVSLINN